MTCPYCLADDAAPLPETFRLCRACGVVFKTLAENAHSALTRQIYSTASWGRGRAQSMMAHGPRLAKLLNLAHQRSAFTAGATALDIGAGVGVLESLMAQYFPEVVLTAYEPVPSLAAMLSQAHARVKVKQVDFEHVAPATFDVILCFGVDYLFRDLGAALAKMARMGSRTLISRNVFLEMPCFWGGSPIGTFAELVTPNPLISVYMHTDQYTEWLRRHFEIGRMADVREAFPSGLEMVSFFADVSPRATPLPAAPVRDVARARARLAALGVAA